MKSTRDQPAAPSAAVGTVQRAHLSLALHHALKHASTDTTREHLCAVLLRLRKNTLTACATDGHRLITFAVPIVDYAIDGDLLLSRADAGRLVRVIAAHKAPLVKPPRKKRRNRWDPKPALGAAVNEREPVSFSLAARTFSVGGVTYTARPHVAEFPNLDRVIKVPAANGRNVAHIQPRYFVDAMLACHAILGPLFTGRAAAISLYADALDPIRVDASNENTGLACTVVIMPVRA